MENDQQQDNNQVEAVPLGTAIQLEQSLPLSWEVFEADGFRSMADRLNATNERVLKTILSLDDLQAEHHDDSGHESSRIAALEHKVDILNDLLSYVLARQIELPEPRQVKINAAGIEWQENHMDVPTMGQYILVDLYLREDYPRPLELLCQCLDVSPDAGSIKIQCKFYGINPAVLDLVEKLVFRAHRRSIAQHKPSNT